MRRVALMVASIAMLAACQGQTSSTPPMVSASSPGGVPTQRSHGIAVRDDILQAEVARRISALGARPFRAVTVAVWNGRVLLMGAVIKPEQRRRAEQAVRAVASNAEILNELVLAEDGALDLFLPDTAREAQLRAQFALEGEGAPILRVIHGVVFLLGAARTAEDAESLKEAVEDADGVKWVVNHLTPAG